jgi:hypothetical protein
LCDGDPPDDFVEKNFDKSAKPLAELLASLEFMPPPDVVKAYQEVLLAPLISDTSVGMYSKM